MHQSIPTKGCLECKQVISKGYLERAFPDTRASPQVAIQEYLERAFPYTRASTQDDLRRSARNWQFVECFVQLYHVYQLNGFFYNNETVCNFVKLNNYRRNLV